MRVGLVGWGCRTGLGQLNADLAALAPWLTAWLVPEHPRLGMASELLPARKALPCAATGDERRYELFLDGVDAILFVERQYVREGFDLVEAAAARGKLVCAIPMLEFLRDDESWLARAGLLWAPTRWSRAELRALAARRACHARASGEARWRSPWERRLAGGRLGVDLARFAFRPRERCERFLFVNGWGGYMARKGADLVARAAALAPEVPLRVRSQVELPELPPHVELELRDAPERDALYAEGDVLVAPSRWEGYGHTLYEAQACGLPVLTTDAPPMDECGGTPLPVARKALLKARRRLLSHEVAPETLASAMRALHGRPLGAESLAARRRMERHHDLRRTLAALGKAIERTWRSGPAPRPAADQPAASHEPSMER
jgi:glycosyltransferase involved in cell wall biosynthesis